MITTAALPPTRQETVRELLATVTEHDGISPLDEAAVLALDGESAQHLLVEEAGALRGYASVLPDGTVQGMVAPAHRRRGHGTALLQEALALRPDAGVWAHG
ncbi:MAG: GNAT family N-acetyltransferase, partial [Brachybacterium sp.]|nr:GNAT family N-acetyltransferase [Brachybacterium sp.]